MEKYKKKILMNEIIFYFVCEASKLMKCNLLDGKMHLSNFRLESNPYKRLVSVFECENPWYLLCICEIEFRINGNDFNVKYGRNVQSETF